MQYKPKRVNNIFVEYYGTNSGKMSVLSLNRKVNRKSERYAESEANLRPQFEGLNDNTHLTYHL